MKEIQQWIEVAARSERVRQFCGSSQLYLPVDLVEVS
jgi:hypothetical protein